MRVYKTFVIISLRKRKKKQPHLNEFLVIHFSSFSFNDRPRCVLAQTLLVSVKWARACAMGSRIFFFVFIWAKKKYYYCCFCCCCCYYCLGSCVPIVCEFEVCLYVRKKKKQRQQQHTFLLDEFFSKSLSTSYRRVVLILSLSRSLLHTRASVCSLRLPHCGTHFMYILRVCVALWPIFIFGI